MFIMEIITLSKHESTEQAVCLLLGGALSRSCMQGAAVDTLDSEGKSCLHVCNPRVYESQVRRWPASERWL